MRHKRVAMAPAPVGRLGGGSPGKETLVGLRRQRAGCQKKCAGQPLPLGGSASLTLLDPPYTLLDPPYICSWTQAA